MQEMYQLEGNDDDEGEIFSIQLLNMENAEDSSKK